MLIPNRVFSNLVSFLIFMATLGPIWCQNTDIKIMIHKDCQLLRKTQCYLFQALNVNDPESQTTFHPPAD